MKSTETTHFAKTMPSTGAECDTPNASRLHERAQERTIHITPSTKPQSAATLGQAVHLF
jgi:hypothetical protein